jgi:hypothetical protein
LQAFSSKRLSHGFVPFNFDFDIYFFHSIQ